MRDACIIGHPNPLRELIDNEKGLVSGGHTIVDHVAASAAAGAYAGGGIGGTIGGTIGAAVGPGVGAVVGGLSGFIEHLSE
jgi:hypothetical protein